MSEALWVEKYRPHTVKDCILPRRMKATFQQMVNNHDLSNMILSGSAGTGKTTVARALCDEMGAEYLFINASDENGIDTIRVKIRQFASTISLDDSPKVVILDEADYLNPHSAQPALRAFIEEFSDNCRFILTCNFKNKIIDPLQSRCTVIDFSYDKAEKDQTMARVFQSMCGILDSENIEYDEKAVAELVKYRFPDTRKIINQLQIYSRAGGVIDEGILTRVGEVDTGALFRNMKEKRFKEVRKWAVDNIDNDPTALYRSIYDGLYDHLTPSSIPMAAVLVADYQYKAAFVVDQEINVVALLTEIMMQCDFKD